MDALDSNQADVMFPEYEKLKAMLNSTIKFALVVRNVAVLDSRARAALVKARIGMPERTVNLNQRIDRREVKIIAKAAQSVLLLVGNAHAIEDGGEFLLESVVRFAGATSRDLIGSQFSMALARFIARKLAAIGGADLLYGFWGMRATVHAVFNTVMSLARAHIDMSGSKQLYYPSGRATKGGCNLPAIHPILVHRNDAGLVCIAHLCIMFPSTLTRAKLSAPGFFMALE